jgi:hypothetical protein
MRDMILGELWLEIDEAIAQAGGATYGIITKVINTNKKQFPWLTRNMVNYFRTNKRKKATTTGN